MIKCIIKKNNFKRAFTIAEMLIVLLIISIVSISFLLLAQHKIETASSTPSGTSEPSYWTQLADNSIYYGISDYEKVVIGANTSDTTNLSKLQISATNSQDSILIKDQSTSVAKIHVGSDNSVSLGNYTPRANAVTIGIDTDKTTTAKSIAIGASTSAAYSIAIAPQNWGTSTGTYQNIAGGEDSIAIGCSSRTGGGLIAINSDIGNSPTGSNNIAINSDLTTSGSSNIISINQNTDWGSNTITIGPSFILTDSSVAINKIYIEGSGTTISTPNRITIGDGASTGSNNDIAIGQNAYANSYNPYSSYDTNIAIGYNAINGPNTYNSVVIGYNATNNYDTTYFNNKVTVIGANARSNICTKAASGIPEAYNHYYILGVIYNSVKIPGTLIMTDNYGNYQKTVSSDIRLKNIKGNFNAGLKEIKELKTFDYTFKKDKTKTPHVGLIAQDLQKTFPKSVKKHKGNLIIKRDEVYYAIFNALKELNNKYKSASEKVDKLCLKIKNVNAESQKYLISIKQKQKRISELKQKNNELEKRISKLESTLK